MSERRLIVNADDLGWTAGVNAGIFEAHSNGVVSSATLMVNAPGAEDAAEALADPELAGLGVGLHFVLSGGGRPTSPPDAVPSLVDERGRLPRRPEGLTNARPEHIRRELRAQLRRFETLMGRPPTHLDGHHHVHRRPAVFAAVLEIAPLHDLPVRSLDEEMRARLSQEDIATPDSFDASFYGEGVTREALLALIRGLDERTTEIMCHPARIDDDLRDTSSYVDERLTELEILTHPEVRGAISAGNIRLIGFGDL